MSHPDQLSRESALSPAEPGPVTRTLLRWLMRPAHVTRVQAVSPHFRILDLEGNALRGIAWSAGQKIQVAIGSGLSARTFTPMSWDGVHGRTRLLVFAHGDGPGSLWASGVREGDICQFFGPRRSLDLSELAPPVVLFGDETSFGLAVALRENREGTSATCVFETSDVQEARPVLEAMGLSESILIARAAGDSHLATVEAKMLHLAASGAHVILTGKASSIQRLSKALKADGVVSSRIKSKAYWALGKAGLD